jgi:hypothetical protein
LLKKKKTNKKLGSKTGTLNSNPLRWNDFESTCLEGTIPHLEFSIEIQSNNLTYQGNPYTKYQQFLYTLIKCLHDKGYGYRRIAHKLNKWNVNTTIRLVSSITIFSI